MHECTDVRDQDQTTRLFIQSACARDGWIAR